MTRALGVIILLATIGLATGCDFRREKPGSVEDEQVNGKREEETPLLPTYSSIRAKILGPRCVGCHSPAGRGKNFPLDTHDDLLHPKVGDALVMAGDPQESGLWIFISLPADHPKRMPEPPSPPLSAEEIAAVEKWILDGALP